uniref:Uncharacterized protein n=1 Tax=Arundo donax TaxID=35708 RepID=A0A0A9D310_ARUDO
MPSHTLHALYAYSDACITLYSTTPHHTRSAGNKLTNKRWTDANKPREGSSLVSIHSFVTKVLAAAHSSCSSVEVVCGHHQLQRYLWFDRKLRRLLPTATPNQTMFQPAKQTTTAWK